jgi:hypothetical protein
MGHLYHISNKYRSDKSVLISMSSQVDPAREGLNKMLYKVTTACGSRFSYYILKPQGLSYVNIAYWEIVFTFRDNLFIYIYIYIYAFL